MTTFGSSQEETDVPDEGMKIAAKVRRETATIDGISVKLQIHEQQMAQLQKEIESLKGLYSTLMNMYATLQAQRAQELQGRGTGPTA